MTDRPLSVVILAAGKGTRMKSARPKVLHPLAGRPLILHTLQTVAELRADRTVLVVGHRSEDVRSALAGAAGLEFVVQSPQLGTGHALLQTEPLLGSASGTLLLLYADVPLLQANTLRRLLERHRGATSMLTVLTTTLDDPYGHGRLVRDPGGRPIRVVEEDEASADEQRVREVNTGIYCFELSPLFAALRDLAADHAQGEYYLTDLVALYHRRGLRIEALCLESGAELRGVNSRVDLAEVTRVLRQRKNRDVMLGGVTLEDPTTTYIDGAVTIGADTEIGPGVQLEGRTAIGARCRIHARVRLTDATIGDDVTVLDGSVIVESAVAAGARIGPYAHLRPASSVGEGAHVGNFVELKKTTLGRGSKANHLAYLGDASIGDGVNVGAGTITCNYDGEEKHETVIEDGAFIGSDSQLIAPVRVGRGAYVAAGSSITHDVPPEALAVGRARQENKPSWAARRRGRRTPERS